MRIQNKNSNKLPQPGTTNHRQNSCNLEIRNAKNNDWRVVTKNWYDKTLFAGCGENTELPREWQLAKKIIVIWNSVKKEKTDFPGKPLTPYRICTDISLTNAYT